MSKAAAIQDFSQIKTVKGAIPSKGVHYITASKSSSKENELAFDVYTPLELSEIEAQQEQATAQAASQTPTVTIDRHASLINLAACIKRNEDGAYIGDEDNIVKFAKETGPLFGTNKSHETVRAWLYAADTALHAIQLQELLNTKSRSSFLIASRFVQKRTVVCERPRSEFSVYQMTVAADNEYRDFFDNLPSIRKSKSAGMYYYAFFNKEEGSDVIKGKGGSASLAIDITLVTFKSEISNASFRAFRYFATAGNLNLADEALEAFDRETLETNPQAKLAGAEEFGANTEITVTQTSLTADDTEAVKSLVQALAVLHLTHSTVDVFQADSTTGFLSFDNYLSWLWFDFSQKLSTVRIGYCQNCGRAFTLAGHRGLRKQYCSEHCKDTAKNDRSQDMRNEVRALFKNGKSVATIMEETDKSRSYVVTQIIKDTKLKHELEDEIEQYGFKQSKLFKRCYLELARHKDDTHISEADLKNLLTSKRYKELKDSLKLLK